MILITIQWSVAMTSHLIVSMNATHVSVEAAQFSEHTATLLTEMGLDTFRLCMHSLQQSHPQ